MSTSPKILKILILEDNPADAELSIRELKNHLPEYEYVSRIVEDKISYLDAIKNFGPDIILSDYNLPQYNGLQALEDLNDKSNLIPFLFVTGALSEEQVAETIKKGAWDYVVKERLFRLPTAVKTSIEIKEKRIKSKLAEEENLRLAMVANNTTNLVFVTDGKGRILWANPAFTKITGYELSEVAGKIPGDLMEGPESSQSQKTFMREQLINRTGFRNVEIVNYKKSGSPYWISLEVQPINDESGKVAYFIAIGSDITERKNAEDILMKKNEELTKINQELDQFVYSVSHNLRAPIASLLGLIEIAKYEKDINEINQMLVLQKNSLLQLDEIIHEIINFSRNARLEVNPERINFNALIKGILDHYQYLEQYNRIKKIVQVSEASEAISDPYRLSIILNNLISNALRFADLSKTEPYIKISAETNSETIEIKVEDNGDGIAKDFQRKIFDMFFRGSEKSSGSGIGLYIVKEALIKLNGTIELKSTLSQGSEFIVKIPNKLIRHQ